MALSKRQKTYAIKGVKRHDDDTGSPEAQISILTREIEELSKHLKRHPKDDHSRKGLLDKVARRRRHMRYLQENDVEGYNRVAEKWDFKKIEA